MNSHDRSETRHVWLKYTPVPKVVGGRSPKGIWGTTVLTSTSQNLIKEHRVFGFDDFATLKFSFPSKCLKHPITILTTLSCSSWLVQTGGFWSVS